MKSLNLRIKLEKKNTMRRLRLLFGLSISCVASLAMPTAHAAEEIPYWLTNSKELYKESPREAAKAWFREANFGLFVHLNMASLLERGKMDYGPWMAGDASDRSVKFVGYTRAQYDAAETKQQRTDLLFQKYTLKEFDAEKICDLAVAAEMKYITFTTEHLGGCVNFRTKLNKLNSVNAPAGRDLVGELVVECKKRGLVLFLYVPPSYAQTRDAKQIQHNRAYLTELLTQYGPVGGIWFDGLGQFYRDPQNYQGTEETYAMIRTLQPQALISFKNGAFLEEDYISPESYLPPFEWEFDTPGRRKRFDKSKSNWSKRQDLWEKSNKHKLREVCTTMLLYPGRDGVKFKDTPAGWINDEQARHLTADQVYYWLSYSRNAGANMLMNIGPRADGSIHPDDWKSLTETGELIRSKGWPALKNRPESRGE